MAHARLIVCLLFCCFAVPMSAQGPPSSVRVSPALHRQVQEHRRVTGEIRSKHRARIAAVEPGWVVDVAVEAGQQVAEGDLLARVDARRLQIALDRARADGLRSSVVVEEREALLERAKVEFDALSALAERSAANPKELRDSELELRVAKTQLDAAKHDRVALQADVDLLQVRIADTEIRARWSGRVIAKFTEVGQWLSVGADVVELISTESLEAWISVPQRDYGALENQTSGFEVVADAIGEKIESVSFRSIPLIDPRGRTFQVVASLKPNKNLAPGMSVTAWVPTGASVNGLLIPRSAIMRNDVGAFVYMVKPGAEGQPSSAVPVSISPKYSIGDAVVCDERTLPPGSQVVTEGNERLYPMAPIIPMPEFEQASTGADEQ
ncbi:MAG: RND family efflux transporter MFP subunit [Planctomycetota bacterium]|jgi:RND family efflux transporter MFP subunit